MTYFTDNYINVINLQQWNVFEFYVIHIKRKLLTKCISGKNERRRSSARKEKKISKKRGNDHAT